MLVTLLDKSAFQALSHREHIFLQKHFYPAITPILAFEVLADLSKKVAAGRLPAAVVQEQARKFIGSGRPVNMHYLILATQSLLGADIPMTGQMIPDNWAVSKSGGVLIDLSPLNHSILRWSAGSFTEDEVRLAQLWRRVAEAVSFESLRRHLNRYAVIVPQAKRKEEVVQVADELLATSSLQVVWLDWVLGEFVLDPAVRASVRARWAGAAEVSLREFAPYAAHCVRAMLSMVVAVQHGHAKWKGSNLLDLQYVYYLPFCAIFVSDDRVHRLLVPGLMRPNQVFLRGPDFKAGLRSLVERWEALSDDQRAREQYALGMYPPTAENPLVYDLWRRFAGPWKGSGNLVTGLTEDERRLALHEAEEMFRER